MLKTCLPNGISGQKNSKAVGGTRSKDTDKAYGAEITIGSSLHVLLQDQSTHWDSTNISRIPLEGKEISQIGPFSAVAGQLQF